MGKGLGYRFITSSIFQFFNKTDFELYLFEIYLLDHYNVLLKYLCGATAILKLNPSV